MRCRARGNARQLADRRSTGYVSEEESDLSFERYQTDPGAILVELQERYQLETLWHERGRSQWTRALISSRQHPRSRPATRAAPTRHAGPP